MSSRDLRPEESATELNGGKEGGGALGVAGGDAAPLLEAHKGVFDQVTQRVEVLVVLARLLAVGAWRNDDLHPGNFSELGDGVGVVAFVGHQAVGGKVPGQRRSLSAIRDGTRSNNGSERHTMRIHGQMYFRVSPPFVRPISSLPPIAPAACACAFT